MPAAPFADRARIDAREKVLGATKYVADLQFPRTLYAMLVPARITKGRVRSLPTGAALRVPGVVRVLTPADFPPPPPPPPEGQEGPPPPPPTLVPVVSYRGQPIALVVAETLEAAIEGAQALRPTFAPAPFAASVDSTGARRERSENVTAGDATRALAGAAATIDATYESPTQHHNPIELLATTAVWANGRLTIYECSQDTGGIRRDVARALRVDPAIIDVKSATIGGGFGQKARLRQTAIVARAAMLIGRPVKLVQPRGQIFHNAGYRPYSRHRIRIGANAEGKIVAVRHDAEQEQSPRGQYAAADHHEEVTRLYGIENYLGTATEIRLDRNDPGYMRGTHAQPSVFALESALDELAYKMGRDPVEMRLANGTRVDVQNGRPLSSRFLSECLTEGSRRFGWSRRTPAPLSMRRPDGTQVGWGVASGIYHSPAGPAIARLRIGADGTTRFAIGGHEMGQGMRNVIAATLLDGLDLDPEKLEILIGDTTAAPQHITGGSWGTSSVVPATARAVGRMRSAMSDLLAGRQIPGNLHRQLAAVRRPFLQIEVSQLAPGQDASALQQLRQSGYAVAGPAFPAFTTFSYSAHFVEVHVEPGTRRVRVPRVVSIADCGRVVSPRTAASQVYGGVVWGLSHALREATEVDPRSGGYLNNDLADYVVAVNADIGEIDVGLIDRPDPMSNSVGVKGLGQVSMVGVSAAVANAVFHATGRRLRELPIRVEHLL